MMWFVFAVIVLYTAYCASFIFLQYYFIFRPKKLKEDFKFSPAQPFEELLIKTSDGEKLNALYLHSKDNKGLVLYMHGNWENLSNYLPYTKKFTDHGYNVLIPDYRGFGKSTGRLTEEIFFSDCECWYHWATKKFSPEKIIVYGRSLGTAPATWLASKIPSKYLILETPYCNMYDLARRYGMLIPTGNYLPFSLRTDVFMGKVTAPIIILHGTKDKTVPIYSGRKLKKYLKDGDQFIEIAGGRHKSLDSFKSYHEALDRLLGERVSK